jgi:hypothetical protein
MNSSGSIKLNPQPREDGCGGCPKRLRILWSLSEINATLAKIFITVDFSEMALLGEADMVFKARCSLTREQRGSHALNCAMHTSEFLDGEENDKEGVMRPSRSKFTGPMPIGFDLMTHAVSLSPEVSSLSCPDCEVPFDLHQPDDNQPTQLLGVCCSCNKWYFLVEIEPEWNGALLFELPSADEIRELLGAQAASV